MGLRVVKGLLHQLPGQRPLGFGRDRRAVELGGQHLPQDFREARAGPQTEGNEIRAADIGLFPPPLGDVAGKVLLQALLVGGRHEVEQKFQPQPLQHLPEAEHVRMLFALLALPALQPGAEVAGLFAQVKDGRPPLRRQAEAFINAAGILVIEVVAKGQKVGQPVLHRLIKVKQVVPAHHFAHAQEGFPPGGNERQQGADGLEQSQFLHAQETGRGIGFRAHVAVFMVNARTAQLVQQIERQHVLDEPFRRRVKMEAVTLLEAHGPQAARGILHKAQGMQHANDAVLDVPLPAEKIHHLSIRRTVQPDGEGIDGEIPSEQIHLDGGEFHRGQGRRIFVVFQTGRSHVDAQLLAVRPGVDDHRSHELLVLAHPPVKGLGQGLGQLDAVALHHEVNILVVAVQQDVAHKAAHHIDGQGQLAPQIARQLENGAGMGREAVAHDLGHVARLDGGGVIFLELHGFIGKDIDEVGARDHAQHLAMLHDGHKALPRAHNDGRQFAERGIGRQQGRIAQHVVFHRELAQTVQAGAGSGLRVKDAAAAPRAGHKDRHGLEAEMQHDLVRRPYGLVRFHAHGGGGHVVAGRLVLAELAAQIAHNGVVHLVEHHVAHRGRGRIGMAAAAQFRTDRAHVDEFRPAAGHHLNAILHTTDGKKDGELFHFHEPVRQIGEITEIVFHGRFGNDHGNAVDGIGARRFQQAVQGAHMGAGQLVGGHVVNVVDPHAAREQPGRAFKVRRRGGAVGKGAGIAVDAEAEQGGLVRIQGDVGHGQRLDDKAGHRAHLGPVADGCRHIVPGIGMMIPDLDAHIVPIQQARDMVQTIALPGIHHHEAGNRIPVDVVAFAQVVALAVKVGDNLLQAAFLRARKEQDAGRIEMPDGQHGGKGVKIGIGMAGDKGGNSCHQDWLRG